MITTALDSSCERCNGLNHRSASFLFQRLPTFRVVVKVARYHHPDDEFLRPQLVDPTSEAVARGLVENARRITSLLAIVQRWKTTEVALDGDILGRQQLGTFLAKLDRVRLCWLRRKAKGKNACRRSCRLGCDILRIEPSRPGLEDAVLPD